MSEIYIRTFSGKKFYPLNPEPDQIDIIDIAAGLSKAPRFCGQTTYTYSVAQHSIHVSSILGDKCKLAGLLHDAAEAYMADVPRPVKCLLPDYQIMESKILGAIFSAMNTDYNSDIKNAVHLADEAVLSAEFFTFFPEFYDEDMSSEMKEARTQLKFWESDYFDFSKFLDAYLDAYYNALLH
jgi:hypothetical protein